LISKPRYNEFVIEHFDLDSFRKKEEINREILVRISLKDLYQELTPAAFMLQLRHLMEKVKHNTEGDNIFIQHIEGSHGLYIFKKQVVRESDDDVISRLVRVVETAVQEHGASKIKTDWGKFGG